MTNQLSPLAIAALHNLLENETNSEWNVSECYGSCESAVELRDLLENETNPEWNASGWNACCESAAEKENAETYNPETIASELIEWANNLV